MGKHLPTIDEYLRTTEMLGLPLDCINAKPDPRAESAYIKYGPRPKSPGKAEA